MKSATFRGAALLVSAVILLVSVPRPRHLVKIDKTGPAAWALIERLQLDIAQELRTCFVARATGDEIRALRGQGISFAVLDWNIGNKDYLLVRDPGPAARALLERRGRVAVLESDLILFWTVTGPSAPALPRGLSRKSLPGWSVLPYLRPPAVGPSGLVPAAERDPVIEGILDEVSPQNLRAAVQSLQDFKTRYASTAACETAGTYLYGKLHGFGLPTEYQAFNFQSSYSSRNIIAEVRGVSYPDDILIIGGHYDSYSQTSPETSAPGADDNASGTAAAVEAARILARHPLDFTVRFIAFSAEEWGLYGSAAYAARARGRNERIVGVVNLDMIAYVKKPDTLVDIIVNEASSWLGDKAVRATSAYTTLVPRKTVNASFVYSDHASFWDAGYPALLEIEAGDNPYYHSVTDTIDTLDFDFFTQTTRAALAVLSELAQPVRAGVPATPAGFAGRTVVFYSLFKAAKKVNLSWNAVAGAAGYNVYRSGRSHLDYVKITGSPIAATTYMDAYLGTEAYYYYVVTAVGADGRESNPSREFEVKPESGLGNGSGVPRFALIRNGGRP